MLDQAGPSGSHVAISGVKTELVRRGSGRPLLFLHPEIGMAHADAAIDRLARQFDVIAPSLPGFGRSDLPRAYASVDDLAYFGLDLAEQLDLRNCVLVGCGFGGWVAAEMAVKSTERFSRVILANPAGIKTTDREHRDMVDMFSLSKAELDRAFYADPKFAGFDPSKASEEDIYIRLRNWESTCLFAWSPYMYSPRLFARLHRINRPTLILWGEKDGIAPADYGRAYAKAIPGARFESVAGAARFPHVERPDDFARQIAAFAGN